MSKGLPISKRVCLCCDYWDNLDRKACLKGGSLFILADRLARSRCVCPKKRMEKRSLMERCNEWRKWRPKKTIAILPGIRKKTSDESEVFESDIDSE